MIYFDKREIVSQFKNIKVIFAIIVFIILIVSNIFICIFMSKISIIFSVIISALITTFIYIYFLYFNDFVLKIIKGARELEKNYKLSLKKTSKIIVYSCVGTTVSNGITFNCYSALVNNCQKKILIYPSKSLQIQFGIELEAVLVSNILFEVCYEKN